LAQKEKTWSCIQVNTVCAGVVGIFNIAKELMLLTQGTAHNTGLKIAATSGVSMKPK